MFSSILDISSFFIGMLINLLLIALICYYFKRKYEILEQAQNEQAKIIYNLIQNQVPQKTFDINELMATHLNAPEIVDESDESDSDSDDDEPKIKHLSLSEPSLELSESQITEMQSTPLIITKIKDPELESEPKLELKIDSEDIVQVNTDADYSKMSMKQLKDILSQKGIQSNARMKKNELINLIENGANSTSTSNSSLNLVEEIVEVII
jgi:hypothetical protein